MIRAAAIALTAVLCFAGILRAADEPARREWKVGNDTREALVYVPAAAKSSPAPVVFAFHGHGGTMKHAATTFAYHTHWPEAIVVYMQGLNTPGRLSDPQGRKPGWQSGPGDQDDRDLKFFDAVLKTLRDEYRVDDKRLYATGHSNGGSFTYLLMAARGDVFAAFAPSAAIAGRFQNQLKPKPVMHIAGENDQLVKFDWQKRAMEFVRKLDECEPDGKEWGKNATLYPSKTGNPVVTYIHPGTHAFPNQDVPPAVVKFFKENARK